MELKNYFAQDDQGNVIAGATVSIYEPGTTTLVTGLQDKNGSPLANPFSSATNGLIQFAAALGEYDMNVSSAGRVYTLRVTVADVASALAVLAAADGSTKVGRGAGTVEDALDKIESVTEQDVPWQGGAGNGTTDDTGKVSLASAAVGALKEYKVTAYDDTKGRDLMPDGVAHNQTLGRVYNPRQQFHMPFFGQECLQHWFDKFAGASGINAGDLTTRKLVISGDSTTVGVGATYGTPSALLEDLAEARGYTNVIVTNRGQSGKATFDWISTYLAGDLAANPDLLVLRWGANDPYFGRTVDQFIADLRSGLQTIRASKTVAQLSILLMTPTSMNDVEKGRTEVWSERIGPAIRQAARDFQCAFIDTYALFQNSHDGANVWMDKDTSFYAGGRAIHPHDVLYEHIVGAMAEMIFPPYGTGWKCNSVRNYSDGDTSNRKVSSDLPGTYKAGISMHRMAYNTGSQDGGPYDGIAYTFKQADGATLQVSTPIYDGPYAGAKGAGISVRLGWNNAWSLWFGEIKAGSGILSGGWTDFGGQYSPLTYQMTLEGRVCLNGVIRAGTTSDGTTIFTLPAGYRPRATEILLIASESGNCKLAIDTTGSAKLYGFGSGGTYITLGGVSFRASI